MTYSSSIRYHTSQSLAGVADAVRSFERTRVRRASSWRRGTGDPGVSSPTVKRFRSIRTKTNGTKRGTRVHAHRPTHHTLNVPHPARRWTLDASNVTDPAESCAPRP